MKKYQIPIIAILAVTCLISSGFAQQIRLTEKSNKTTETEATGNISIHLKIYKSGEIKENIAFQIVNGQTAFSVETLPKEEGKIQPRRFNGTLSQIDDQRYLLNYTLSQSVAITTGEGDRETIQFRDAGWKAVVEIKKDEEVVLMKDADSLYTLLIGGSLNNSE